MFFIFGFMDLQAEKLDVLQKVMGITKASLLKKIKQLLDAEMIVGYTVNGEPLTNAQYNSRLEKAERQIESGEFLTQEELEKEVKNW